MKLSMLQILRADSAKKRAYMKVIDDLVKRKILSEDQAHAVIEDKLWEKGEND